MGFICIYWCLFCVGTGVDSDACSLSKNHDAFLYVVLFLEYDLL